MFKPIIRIIEDIIRESTDELVNDLKIPSSVTDETLKILIKRKKKRTQRTEGNVPATTLRPTLAPMITLKPTSTSTTTPLLYGRIVSISFGKDKYYAGETVFSEMIVENTGDVDIISEKVTIRAYCRRLNDFMGNVALKALSKKDRSRTGIRSFSETIKPQQITRFQEKFSTPAKKRGVSLRGKYYIFVTLEVNGKTVDTRRVKLRLH